MATPTLEAYRQLNPQDQRTDSDVLPDLISALQNEGTLHLYPDLQEHAAALARRRAPSLAKEFTQSLASGTDQAQAQLYSTLAQGGAALGLQGVENYGLEGYKRNVAEASELSPTIGTVNEVHGVDDAVRYGLGLVGSQTPQIAGASLAGLAGAAIGGIAGGPPGAAEGALVGSGLGGYTQMQNYADLKLSGGQDPLATSAMVGMVGAMLQAWVPSKVVQRAFGTATKEVTQEAITDILARAEKGIPGISSYLAKHAAIDGLSGGLTGTAQELVTLAGDEYSHRDDPTFKISDKEIFNRLLNNAAAGTFLGGVFGAYEGISEKKRDRFLYDAAVKLKTEQQTAEENQKREEIQTRAKETESALSNFFTTRDPNAGLQEPGEVAEETSPVDEFILREGEPRTKKYLEYYGLFDEANKREEAEAQARQEASAHFEDYKAELRAQEAGLTSPTEETKKVPAAELSQIVPQITSEAALPLIEPSAPMEFSGEIPEPAPKPIARSIVKDELPPLRKEPVLLDPNISAEELQAIGHQGMRANENSKGTTKKYLAVKDNATDKVRLFGMFRSTEGRIRVSNETVAPERSTNAIASAMGLTPSTLANALTGETPRDKAIKKIFGELREGLHGDQFVDELLNEKVKGKQRYTPLALLDGLETVSGKEYEFTSEDEFKSSLGEIYVPSKGSKVLDNRGVNVISDKITKLSPDEGRAVQTLATVLESLPYMQQGPGEEVNLTKRQKAARADPVLIMKGLLKAPRSEVFLEELNSATDPKKFYQKSQGHLFHLFTPEQWSAFVRMAADKTTTAEELLMAVDSGLESYGWKSRQEYLSKVLTEFQQRDLGERYDESRDVNPEAADENNAAATITDMAGREGSSSLSENVLAEGQAAQPRDIVEEASSEDRPPEISEAITGLTDVESSAIRTWLDRDGKDVVDARADSTIVNPVEDLEFQTVEKKLTNFLQRMFEQSRLGEQTPALTRDFVYRVYANLDRTQDSRSMPTSYRVSSNEVAKTFRSVVNYLSDLGVDVNIVQQDINSTVDFFKNEWGRAITTEDGRRVILLTVNDISRPSRENLRTLFHEVAHHLFREDPVWQRRLIHEAIERLGDLQMEVFSKTWDARIKKNNPEGLGRRALLDEILAEHLSFFGVDAAKARSVGQRFVDGITKTFAQVALFLGRLRGVVFAPELVKKYAEIRMSEFVDRALNSTTDLDAFTGNVRDIARYEATFFKPLNGGLSVEVYEPHTGNFVLRDVIDESNAATLFNLDNKLQYSALVVSDNRPIPMTVWQKELGIGFEPAKIRDVLQKIVDRAGTDEVTKEAAKAVRSLSRIAGEATIRVIKDQKDFNRMLDGIGAATGAAYFPEEHEILINGRGIAHYTPKMVADTIVHEAMHAATSKAVSFYESYVRLNRDMEGALFTSNIDDFSPAEQMEMRVSATRIVTNAEHLSRIFDYLKGQDFYRGAYGMTNLHEFISELLSNRIFQMKLTKVILPENLQVEAKKKSVFSTIVDLVHRLLNRGPYSGNAFETALHRTEELILTADPRVGQYYGDHATFLAAPITPAESDERVKSNFEFEFAVTNSQRDFYENVLGPLAAKSNMDIRKYMEDVLEIRDPAASRELLEQKISQLSRPVKINPEYRLTDGHGPENVIPASTDKKQVIKRLVMLANSALNKVTAKKTALEASLAERKRELERTQTRMGNFETSLHDVTEVRDNALRVLRKSLRETEKNAEKLSELSARHTGLFGVAAELFGLRINQALPQDYAALMARSLEEQSHNFRLTDTLTALSTLDIDFNALTPKEIQTEIQKVYAQTHDARLADLVDESPKAKVNLALLTYFAKTQPTDMAALMIRVERDPKRKNQFIKAIKEVIRGNSESAAELNDIFSEVRGGDIKVGKAKKTVMEAARQLRQAKKAVEISELKIEQMGYAANSIKQGLRPWMAELGIRGQRFEPFNGAPVLMTPDASKAPEMGKLELNEKSSVKVIKLYDENVKWLKQNEGIKDDTWQAVSDQTDGLKKVMSEFVDRPYRDSLFNRVFGSSADRLNALGNAQAKLSADRLYMYEAKRRAAERLTLKGAKVSEELAKAMKAVGFEKGYAGFLSVFWNPANHFLQHLQMVPTENVADQEAHAKQQLQNYFNRSDETREVLKKSGSFDQLWTALMANAHVSKEVANLAGEWKAFVEDEDIKIIDPRTGKSTFAQRPAMDVGLYTTQRRMDKLFGVRRTLEDVKDVTGASVWAQWIKDEKFDPLANVDAVFTPEIINQFVLPYIRDSSTLHFDGPVREDRVTRNRAQPLNVQLAWDNAEGNLVKFANNLFDLELPPGQYSEDERKKFVYDTLNFFKGQFKKISALTDKQEQFNQRGLDVLSSPMMDNRKAEDFPPEFVDYRIYDRASLHHIVSSLAAHSAFGRDLGLFATERDVNGGIMWELAAVEEQIKKRAEGYKSLERRIVLQNPKLSLKEIDREIEKTLGPDEFKRQKKTLQEQAEVREVGRDIMAVFTSPNGSTRELTMGMEVIGTITGFMLNQPKTALSQTLQIFEPLIRYRLGAHGFTQVKNNLTAFLQSAAGSVVQGLTGQAHLASKYARYLNDLGLGLDPANSVTSSQILADRGKDNIFEDRRVLGWLRKGRAIMFNTGFKPVQEGERVAPAFRPWAIFSQMSISLNQASMESDLRMYDDLFKKGLEVMKGQPRAFTDPSFKFTPELLRLDRGFDDLAFKEVVAELNHMGTTLETEVKNLLRDEQSGKQLGDIVVSPDLTRLIASRAMDRMSLPNTIATAPSWVFTSKMGRISMPLLVWSTNKLNQLVGSVREPNGEINRRVVMAAAATMMLGMVPASILISMLLDEYDETILNKKSALIGFNPDDPAQTTAALVERMARTGTFGMAGDIINGIRVYGTDGDNRNLSFDQRVIFMNTIMSTMGLINTAVKQEGTLTYNTFWRPFINAVGGGGILQDQQIFNTLSNNLMGVPIFEKEAQVTARLNALNYLRGAGRTLELDVRTGAGMGALSNPTKPWIGEMVVATYSNDREQFLEAYRNAVDSAREEGKADPEDYVKRSFETYHPLRYTFRTPPTKSEVGQLMAALSDKGREDVQNALAMFDSYGMSLGLKPYSGKELVAKKGATEDPYQPKTRRNNANASNPFKPVFNF